MKIWNDGLSCYFKVSSSFNKLYSQWCIFIFIHVFLYYSCFLYLFMYFCIYSWIFTSIHVFLCLFMYFLYLFMYIYIYSCIFIFIYIYTHENNWKIVKTTFFKHLWCLQSFGLNHSYLCISFYSWIAVYTNRWNAFIFVTVLQHYGRVTGVHWNVLMFSKKVKKCLHEY